MLAATAAAVSLTQEVDMAPVMSANMTKADAKQWLEVNGITEADVMAFADTHDIPADVFAAAVEEFGPMEGAPKTGKKAARKMAKKAKKAATDMAQMSGSDKSDKEDGDKPAKKGKKGKKSDKSCSEELA